MKLSFRALKNWVDYPRSAKNLAEDLAHLGFPCDTTSAVGVGLDQVMVAEVREKNKHPGADRLNLLKVFDGSNELPIVCGAHNMKPGDLVAFAPVGATVPGKDGSGLEIKEAKIRGETSQGMCCSEEELLLSEESEGIWILPLSKEKGQAALGKKVSELFDLEDYVLDVDITPNRGDAMCIRGLAREIAAKFSLKLKVGASGKWKNPSDETSPTIESYEDAYGFAACLALGVRVQESPETWKQFLNRMGARPISNLVDISNIVLFEFGHPIHFFDADKVDPKTIEIRRAKEGETLELLNDKTIELSTEDLVVADASGALSLAGIMGGKRSSVSDETKNVLIEVASFNAVRIRQSAQRHQLSSESSQRFEKGVSPFGIQETLERALGLLKELGGYEKAGGNIRLAPDLKRPSVLWDRERVEAKLGKLSQNDDEIFNLLRGLGYEFERHGGGAKVVFPYYRTDVSCLEDVMEDVGRLIGYENLPTVPLVAQESVKVLDEGVFEDELSDYLVDRALRFGFVEVIHPCFTSPKIESNFWGEERTFVHLKNPIHAERNVMRQSLIPQLLERAAFNANYAEDAIRLMEFGPVFNSQKASVYKTSPVAEQMKGAVLWLVRPDDSKELFRRDGDPFFEFKGICDYLFRGVKVEKNKPTFELSFLHPNRIISQKHGFAGEVHPEVMKAFDLNGRCFIAEWTLAGRFKSKTFAQPWRYPAIDLDASFLVSKKISMRELMKRLESVKNPMIEQIRPYDLFEDESLGKDHRSVTFTVRYRQKDRTLELDEAKAVHKELVDGVLSGFSENEITLR